MRHTYAPSFLITTIFLALLAAATAYSQEFGEIRGTVTESETGEPIVRAVVSVGDTKLGSFSDLKGVFTVRRVPHGTYVVTIKALGYEERKVSGVVVSSAAGRVDVALVSAAVTTGAVSITANRGNATENALLITRRNAAAVSDGISLAQIRKSPDATSGDALNRVTGLSMVGNRFVTVRGTNERYNNAQLNGVAMTSTEPDKRAFSFDLFPANLLENTIVSKTFTPDMPGDFAGGLVQLNTVDFPDAATARLAVGASHGSRTTFAAIQQASSGSSDWLGFDDGSRSLPSGFPASNVSDDNYEPAAVDSFARMLPNTWSHRQASARPNANLLISYGDKFSVADNDLGLLAAVTYRNGVTHVPIIRSEPERYRYAGDENSTTTLWGAMANISYKLGELHALSFRNVYTRSAENKLTMIAGEDLYAGQGRERIGMYFLERGFYSGQIAGEHSLPLLNSSRLNWRAFASIGSRREPDFRRATYLRPDISDGESPLMLAISSGAASPANAGHYYSDLEDEVFGGAGDLTIPIDRVRVKSGMLVENKQRYFAARGFGYVARDPSWQFPVASLDTVFDPSHIGEHGLTIDETTASSDHYDAHGNVTAVYVMADLPFDIGTMKLRALLGARYESSLQIINTATRTQPDPITVNYAVDDVLPAISFLLQPIDKLNIRAAYSQTVARPELREFAGFSFYDFTTEQLVYGNPDIKRSLIANYDVRIEYFPGFGELMALSVFHKEFTDAIEAVAINGDIPERTWTNAEHARNTGVEVELRKSFDFISESLSGLALSVNFTWLESSVDVTRTDLTAGKAGRRLQGQSPYLINAGLFYDSEETGTSISLLYNRAGERISEVSRSDSPDFIEQPRDVIDITASQAFMGQYEVKLAVKDILAQDQVFTLDGDAARVNGRETSTSLTLSFRF